jgi:MOSC domain-containing protein YiiM
MQSQIISLNVSHPVDVEWANNGKTKTVRSSMHKKSFEGPLKVGLTNIEGDSFDYKGHGTPDSVLYALALDSIKDYMARFNRVYQPGDLGENITLDIFDEKNISVGDIFQIGEVQAQATFPRIPCGKVNFRMQNDQGQKLLIEHGRSGVYFRILRPGAIKQTDKVIRIKQSPVPISIFEVYHKVNAQHEWTDAECDLIEKNQAFPKDFLKKLGLDKS